MTKALDLDGNLIKEETPIEALDNRLREIWMEGGMMLAEAVEKAIEEDKENFLKFMDDDSQWDHGPVKSKKRYKIQTIKE